MWRVVSCLLKHNELFRTLILCCKFIFMLIVAAVIELTLVPFQQQHHCLLVFSWGNHKSRGFCYPVLCRSVATFGTADWKSSVRRTLPQIASELQNLHIDIGYLRNYKFVITCDKLIWAGTSTVLLFCNY